MKKLMDFSKRIISLLLLTASAGTALASGGTINSGSSVSGTLQPNQVHTFSVDAKSGDAIHLSADSAMQTRLRLYNPDGSLLDTRYNIILKRPVAQTGTYRVTIQTKYANQQGSYQLHFAGSSSANELGLLSSGGLHSDSLSRNDLDSYTIDAKAGDTIHLSAYSAMQTRMDVYNPDGSLLGSRYNIFQHHAIKQTGIYRVVIQTKYAFQKGDYDLHYINSADTNEYGFLKSGGKILKTLTSNDLDSYTIDAKAGDTIHLSADSAMQTRMDVYNPDGSLLGSRYNIFQRHAIKQTGIYRVVIQTKYAFQKGDYVLHFVNSADANEHGLVESGGMRSGNLTSNDLDSFTLVALAGDILDFGVGSAMQARLDLYNPDGSLLKSAYNTIYDTAPEDGVYRLVIQTKYAFQKGDFKLHYANGSSAEEHGYLESGDTRLQTLTSNDLDSYKFKALTGDNISLAVSAPIYTWIAVFKPDGSYLGGGRNGYNFTGLPEDGDYRIILSSNYLFQTGDYQLTFTSSSNAQAKACNGMSLAAYDLKIGASPLFSREKEAVIHAISSVWSYETDWHKREYGGDIFAVCGGPEQNVRMYSYTTYVGEPNVQCPIPATLHFERFLSSVAGWHTHPLSPYTTDSSKFSVADKSFTTTGEYKAPLYMGDPATGIIKRLTNGTIVDTIARIQAPVPPPNYVAIANSESGCY